jgi:hypothetical protein
MPAQRREVRRRGWTTGIRSDVVLELLAVKQKHVPPGHRLFRYRPLSLFAREYSTAGQPGSTVCESLEEISSLHVD